MDQSQIEEGLKLHKKAADACLLLSDWYKAVADAARNRDAMVLRESECLRANHKIRDWLQQLNARQAATPAAGGGGD